MKTIVLSLGGSIIAPDKPDAYFLKQFKNFVLKHVDEYRFVIVTGGGKTNSYYNEAANRVSEVSDENLDWLGIMATRLNGELVRVIFGEIANKEVIYDPAQACEDKRIIVAAGWKPGWSTDTDAVHLARKFGAKQIFNLTNISHVYDKNPKQHKDAKKLYKVSWDEYLKIVGEKWTPRMNSPFDPIASKEAKKTCMQVFVLKGTDLKNLKDAMQGNEFEGTLIG